MVPNIRLSGFGADFADHRTQLYIHTSLDTSTDRSFIGKMMARLCHCNRNIDLMKFFLIYMLPSAGESMMSFSPTEEKDDIVGSSVEITSTTHEH